MNHELSNLGETPSSDRPLSEPHFDDEATLLSARRVVPFHKLALKTNSKRKLFFAFVLATTLMMGVIGGLLYTRLARTPLSNPQTTAPAADSALSDDSVSSSRQDDALESAHEESSPVPVDKDAQKTIDKPRNPSNSVKNRASVNPAPARRVQTEPDELVYPADEREIRRAERRAARRARREAAREAQRSDDLFRIREIFEGTSRP